MDAKEFGAQLRSARKRAGLSQTQVAGKVGCSQRFVSELERGKPTAELGLALRVAGALGLEVGFWRNAGKRGSAGALEETLSRTLAKLHAAPGGRPKLENFLKGGE